MTKAFVTTTITTVLVIFMGVPPTSNLSTDPVITTPSLNLSKPKGQSVEFFCQVENLNGRHIVWRKGFEVLATGSLVLSPDPRIRVEGKSGYTTLTVGNLSQMDAGEYVCQVSTLTKLVAITHRLDILVPASVVSSPPNGVMVVKRGDHVTLKCQVKGNPTPQLTWTKENGVVPSGEVTCPAKTCYSIPSVDQEAAGDYICLASNGVGTPAQARIHLTVLYPPNILVSSDSIHSGVGQNVHLTCQVEGEPNPTVRWFFGDRQIRPAPSAIRKNRNKHTLLLKSLRNTQLGNYSCVAENNLGTFRKYMEVHGRPNAVIFHNKASFSGRQFHKLSWSVTSYTPVSEYRLLYRRIKQVGDMMVNIPDGDWTNVIIPGSDATVQGYSQKMTWRLDQLMPDSQYECLVQSRNIYGWSQPSQMHTFTTRVNGHSSAATQSWSPNSSIAHSFKYFQIFLSSFLQIIIMNIFLFSF